MKASESQESGHDPFGSLNKEHRFSVYLIYLKNIANRRITPTVGNVYYPTIVGKSYLILKLINVVVTLNSGFSND